jgi:predicted phosphodiesterase
MKYAIISDIHSNLEALQKAFEIIDDEKIDEIICLGDIVGYGANPNECVDLVSSRCSTIILGNHDAAVLHPLLFDDYFNPLALKALQWTSEQLTDDSKELLSSLPMVERKGDILFVHSSPSSPELWDYIVDNDAAASAIQNFDQRLCFIGHTHIPGIFSRNGRVKSITREERFLINVGSIGQPRDRNPMLAFGIFDSSAWEYRLVRSEYNIQQAADKIYKAGLPQELGVRLLFGM